MNRLPVGKILVSTVLTVGMPALTACTDNNYDLDDIDVTVGIGNGELSIPTSSTTVIKLGEVLDLEDGGDVVEAADGTYMFNKKGNDVSPTTTTIEKVTVKKASTESFDFVIDLTSAAMAKVRSSVALSKEMVVGSFKYNATLPNEVVELKDASLSSKMSIDFSFNGNMSRLVKNVNSLSLEFPSYMEFEVASCSTAYKKDGNKITMPNVSTAKAHSLVVSINRLNFGQGGNELGSLTANDGKVNMTGNIKMGVDIDGEIDLTETADPKNCMVSNTISFVDDMVLDKVTGRFDPTIAPFNVGTIKVTGIPDFLNEDGVKIDIENPQIQIDFASDLTIPGKVKGTFNYTRKGQKGKIELKEEMTVLPATDGRKTTRICICRDKAKLESPESYDQIIEDDNIKDLFYPTVIDEVSFDATARADEAVACPFELGRKYTIQPEYEVFAPLAFGKEANIVYVESFDNWNDDVSDFDMNDGGYILMTANVENKLPVYLNVEAKAVGLNGVDMSSDVKVEVTGEVKACTDGKSATVSPITVKLTPKKGALKNLDGLKLTISGSAKSAAEGAVVTGIPLNAKTHTLVAKDIQIKIVGTVIADLN